MSNDTVTAPGTPATRAERAQARAMAGPGATREEIRTALACVVVARWLREAE
jgi:hypothetical protein